MLCLVIIILSLINITSYLPNNTLGSGGVFSSSNVSALSYQSSVGLNFTINPSLSISMSSNDLVIPDLVAGTSSESSNNLNVVVATNTLAGYTVSVNTDNEDLVSDYDRNNIANSNINNSNNNEYTNQYVFNSIGDNTYTDITDFNTNADDNTWGYSYSLDSGVSWSNYSGLSMSSNSILYDTNSSADSKTIGFKIGAKASSDQPSGVYTTTINFMAVSKVTPTSLLDAYRNEHKTMVNGYYTMQDMTNTICANTDIYDEQLQVIDIRDNKVYYISKLRDDNCWMTENLDLDLETTPTNVLPLTSDNTDLNLYGSMGYTSSNGYSCSNPDDPEATLTNDCSGEDEIITWAPERDTIPPNDLSAETFPISYSDPYSYDRGLVVLNGNMDGHGYTGNYYNWPAVIASNNSSSYTSGVAANSICPAGWRLPNTASMEGGYEFSKLLYKYGVTTDDQNTSGYASGGFNKIIASPLYFVRGGYVSPYNSSSLVQSGYSSYYWSSPARDRLYARIFYFHSGDIRFGSEQYKSIGLSLRCLAK